jgi:glycosyltransferase involved in cell wall biosynthesis
MIIGIEAQRLFRKKKHGMDMVVLELIRNLQKIDHKNQYYIFVKPDEDDAVIEETSNFKIIPLKGGSYPIWEQFILPKAAKKYGCQVLHCTSNTAPLFCNMPLVTTLHDIIYTESSYYKILKGSATLYQKFGNVYRKLVVPQVVKQSRKIITVSHFEKNRIAQFFEMEGDNRLAAVYNGVSDYFKPISNETELKTVKEKYHLSENFFFFLGNTDPKKNTKGTLKAFSDFLKQTKSDFKLVMLDYDVIELKQLLKEIGDEELINNIVLTGYITNTDLPAIYSLSKIFLYPSLRESFGIPMLEAMACGVPVITSNTSSMPEIAGDAAHIINPYNPLEITQAMIKILEDEKYYKELCSNGKERKQLFSWNNMAEQVLRLYNEINVQHHD